MKKEAKISIGLSAILIIYLAVLYLLKIKPVWVGLP